QMRTVRRHEQVRWQSLRGLCPRTRSDLPNADCIIDTAADDAFTIRRKSYTVNSPLVSAEFPNSSTRRVQKLDLPCKIEERESFTFRRKHQCPDILRVVWQIQSEGFAAPWHIPNSQRAIERG